MRTAARARSGRASDAGGRGSSLASQRLSSGHRFLHSQRVDAHLNYTPSVWCENVSGPRGADNFCSTPDQPLRDDWGVLCNRRNDGGRVRNASGACPFLQSQRDYKTRNIWQKHRKTRNHGAGAPRNGRTFGPRRPRFIYISQPNNGRGPDAGRTIQSNGTDADRTRAQPFLPLHSRVAPPAGSGGMVVAAGCRCS
eukprot:gene8502-biopygen9176